MADDKFPAAEEDDNILEAENADRDNLRAGNIPPRMTTAEALAEVTSNTDLLFYNTDSGHLEYWHGENDRRILDV